MKTFTFLFFLIFSGVGQNLIAPETVLDIIENSADHDTLEAALTAADLDDVLEGEGPFTVIFQKLY
jgi:uncharacterized surface protein with fasciclin (FAS1) repeats